MNLEGKTVLVTGSTDGVGRFVARRLAGWGARALIHGRDHARGEQLVDEIRAAGAGSATFHPADFSSLAEVRRLAGVVRQSCERLDILINNAGIGSGGPNGHRQTSQDGHELRFAVNYLAGFALTRMLLSLLMAQQAGSHRERLLAWAAPDRLWRCHAHSRVQRLAGLCAEQARPDHVHIRSRMRARSRDYLSELPASHYMATTMVRQSGVTAISTVSEGLSGRSGQFYSGLRLSRASPQAYDESARKRLRVLSLQLTGLE
jgi:NAD(P)-dependent dehydrogenase (short-subunit alcohol dehydrogenase family)